MTFDTLLALGALLLSAVALWRTRRIPKLHGRLLELEIAQREAERAAESRTDLLVNVEPGITLNIENIGAAAAHDVVITGALENQPDVTIEKILGRPIPVISRIEPHGGEWHLSIPWSEYFGPPLKLQLHWRDAAGDHDDERVAHW